MTEENKARLEILARANAWLYDDLESFKANYSEDDDEYIDGIKTFELLQEIINNEAIKTYGKEIDLWGIFYGETKL